MKSKLFDISLFCCRVCSSLIDTVGGLAVVGVGAAFAGHGVIQIMKRVGDKAEPIEAKPTGDA